MRLWAGALVVLAACAAGPSQLGAQENKDLDLIPKTLADSEPRQHPEGTGTSASARGAQEKYYVEDALTVSALRGGLIVPQPPPSPVPWHNRTSLDLNRQWTLAKRVTATFSDRLNLSEENDVDFPSRQSVRNDFREGYLTLEALTRFYLEAGRINVRNGIALGFNPTDFFKTRTLLDQASLDPSVLREDRLGTLMLRGQRIWGGGSASVAFAPKLYAPTALTAGMSYGLGPKVGRTNAANRLLVSLNYDIADLSPQALIYREGSQTILGVNLSRPVSQSIVGYAEWAGGRQPSLIEQAISYGKRTGSLPASAPVLPPSEAADAFRSDLAVGASWSSIAKLTINIEYHYHQSGLSRQDWSNWFGIGGAQHNFAQHNFLPVTGELWYIRGFANDQQQPLTRHQVFVRADWTDAFIPHLELAAFAFVNLYDGSSLTQLSANYYVSDAWTLGAYASANVGGARSERGSFPQAASMIIQLVRYF